MALRLFADDELVNGVTLAFLLGMGVVQHWARLPTATEYFTLLVMAVLFCHWCRRFIGFLLLGALWASAYGHWRLADSLA
ncbi:MAG: hypothetical protein PHH11_16795, partial [Methylomonas sp.]|nr:hypothetical protein [Methylomonas sp.]